MYNLRSEVGTWLTDDQLYDAKKNTDDELARAADVMRKHFLLRSHAVLCGLTMYHFSLLSTEAGLRMMNNSYHIPQMAHLHNSIQLDHGEALPWPDLEAFMSMHGEDRVFVGERPKTAAESLDRLKALGELDGRKKYLESPRRPQDLLDADWVWLTPMVSLALLLKPRYIANKQLEICNADVDQILKQIDLNRHGNGNEHASWPTMKKLRERWTLTHRMEICQFLAVIKHAVYQEEPLLQFDFLGLDQRCVQLFRLIRAKELSTMKFLFPNYGIPDGAEIATVGAYILTIDKTYKLWLEQNDNALTEPEPGSYADIARKLLPKCAQIMQGWLPAHGDKACRELKAFCKHKSVSDVEGLLARAREMTTEFWLTHEHSISDAEAVAIWKGYLKGEARHT